MKKRKLKIAEFCTNEWPTPPPGNIFYAPLWISYYIAEGLAKKGHNVFYFGSKESRLKYAKLVSFGMKALRYNKKILPYFRKKGEEACNFYEQLMISKIYEISKKEKFDIIHIHPYRRCVQMANLSDRPTVITIHDPVKGLTKFMLSQTKKIPQIYLISISNNQRKPLKNLNWAGTCYNGIDIKKYKFRKKASDYFAAAGRFVPEKGIDIAIELARKIGIKLKIAGGPAKGEFFEKKIKPFLKGNIEYVGMLPFSKMSEFYGKAKAILYPLRWQEPFGLIFIEAMASGTPVIAFNRGSVPEIVKDKKTGFVVNNLEQMKRAIKDIDKIKREDCRKWVENNFTIETMSDCYEKTFLKIANLS